MSVVIETTLGDITVDLFLYERPRACLNFLKLCKIRYYNYNLFHTISRGFIAQTGDPTGARSGGESIFAVIDGPSKKFFEAENEPRIKHTRPGLISFVGSDDNMIASQFFLTLGEDLTYLDEKHCVFGEVVEGLEILESINEVICDNDDRPFQDVRITHTVVLDDPYPDPKGLMVPSRSPSPSAERLAGGRIAPDEEIDEMSGKSAKEIAEMQAEREAKARAAILEMVGDIPDADMAPPENVLFVCKLNPITNDDELEIIFSRFGKIKSCEVIRDRKSGDSLQYAFIEFEDQKSCEDAYFKMDNVLVDDRRLHVDFSQSVSKVKWLGKGRGVKHFDEKGNKRRADVNNDIGRGEYKVKNGSRFKSVDKGRNRRSSRSASRDGEKNRLSKKQKLSQSPKRSGPKSRSPQPNRRQSRSPTRKRPNSRSPLRKSVTPVKGTKHSRSPDHFPRKNDRRYSPKRWPGSPSHRRTAFRRHTDRYSPRRKSGSSRRRSRSPWRSDRSPVQNRRNYLTGRQSRSPKRKSRSPTLNSKFLIIRSSSPEERSKSSWEKSDMLSVKNRLLQSKLSRSLTKPDLPTTQKKKQEGSPRKSGSPEKRTDTSKERSASRKTEEKFLKKQDSSLKERSKSPNISSSEYPSVKKGINAEDKYKIKGDIKTSESRDRSSKKQRHGKERLYSEDQILGEKARKTVEQKSKLKVKKAKISKKSKKYESSEESSTDSEEDRKKSNKKKSKKKVESSTDSSSSEESSSSSEEEVEKKKAKKRKTKKDSKKKRSKKAKRRESSSSSDSFSDSSSDSDSSSSSSSSSSDSKSDNYKKKRSKKKRPKTSSESD